MSGGCSEYAMSDVTVKTIVAMTSAVPNEKLRIGVHRQNACDGEVNVDECE